MVAAETDCPDVLPGEFRRLQTDDGVPGHAGWGVVPAERITGTPPAVRYYRYRTQGIPENEENGLFFRGVEADEKYYEVYC
jgi:hypothetical protein